MNSCRLMVLENIKRSNPSGRFHLQILKVRSCSSGFMSSDIIKSYNKTETTNLRMMFRSLQTARRKLTEVTEVLRGYLLDCRTKGCSWWRTTRGEFFVGLINVLLFFIIIKFD